MVLTDIGVHANWLNKFKLLKFGLQEGFFDYIGMFEWDFLGNNLPMRAKNGILYGVLL